MQNILRAEGARVGTYIQSFLILVTVSLSLFSSLTLLDHTLYVSVTMSVLCALIKRPFLPPVQAKAAVKTIIRPVFEFPNLI